MSWYKRDLLEHADKADPNGFITVSHEVPRTARRIAVYTGPQVIVMGPTNLVRLILSSTNAEVCKKALYLADICHNLLTCIECQEKGAFSIFIVDDEFNSSGSFRLAPGGLYRNVKKSLSCLETASAEFAVKRLEVLLDGFGCLGNGTNNPDQKIDYCFILRSVFDCLTTIDASEELCHSGTLRAFMDLRMKVTRLLIHHCFVDEKSSKLLEGPVLICKQLIKEPVRDLFYIKRRFFLDFLKDVREDLSGAAKTLLFEVSPDDISDGCLAVLASVSSLGTLEKKKKELKNAKKEYEGRRRRAIDKGVNAALKLTKEVISVIVRIYQGLAFLDTISKIASPCLKNILEAAPCLKKILGTSKGRNLWKQSPFAKALLKYEAVRIPEDVVSQAFMALSSFLKAYRMDQTIRLIDERLNKVGVDEERFNSFADRLSLYFECRKNERSSDDVLGFLVGWTVSPKGETFRSFQPRVCVIRRPSEKD